VGRCNRDIKSFGNQGGFRAVERGLLSVAAVVIVIIEVHTLRGSRHSQGYSDVPSTEAAMW